MAVRLDMSENIKTYITDIEKDLFALENEIKQIGISLSPVSSSHISKIENIIPEIEANLRNIEVEMSCMTQATKDKYNALLKCYNEKLTKHKSDYLMITKSYRNQMDIAQSNSSSKIIKANQDLNEGTNMVCESIKVISSANQTGKETIESLETQRRIIADCGKKLEDTSSFFARSGKVVSQLVKRVTANKCVLISLIILLAVMNLFLVYLKLKLKHILK